MSDPIDGEFKPSLEQLTIMVARCDMARAARAMSGEKITYSMLSKVLSLREHIDQNHNGNQSDYAREIGVTKQQITKWLKNEVIMVNGSMYSPVKSKPKG